MLLSKTVSLSMCTTISFSGARFIQFLFFYSKFITHVLSKYPCLFHNNFISKFYTLYAPAIFSGTWTISPFNHFKFLQHNHNQWMALPHKRDQQIHRDGNNCLSSLPDTNTTVSKIFLTKKMLTLTMKFLVLLLSETMLTTLKYGNHVPTWVSTINIHPWHW